MREEFPNDEACLKFLFEKRYGNLRACYKCGTVKPRFYPVKGRKSFACNDCGYHIYPLVGTIFEKTTTPLIYWLHAIYLFSVSKNGVAAKELERQIGVSYKTAHRMEKQIRLLMSEGGKLGDMGTPIEVDEAYIGGKRKQSSYHDNKTPILAALEVGGHVRTRVVPRAHSLHTLPFLEDYVYEGSTLHTDESKLYKHLKVKQSYNHASIRHIAKEFVKDGVTTNHVEGFLGQLKRSLDGTYHAVSPRYLSWYVSEFAYRYNHRNELIFPLLLAKAAQPRSAIR